MVGEEVLAGTARLEVPNLRSDYDCSAGNALAASQWLAPALGVAVVVAFDVVVVVAAGALLALVPWPQPVVGRLAVGSAFAAAVAEAGGVGEGSRKAVLPSVASWWPFVAGSCSASGLGNPYPCRLAAGACVAVAGACIAAGRSAVAATL